MMIDVTAGHRIIRSVLVVDGANAASMLMLYWQAAY